MTRVSIHIPRTDLPDLFIIINIEIQLEKAGKDTKKPGPIKNLLKKAYSLMRKGHVQAALEIVDQLRGFL